MNLFNWCFQNLLFQKTNLMEKSMEQIRYSITSLILRFWIWNRPCQWWGCEKLIFLHWQCNNDEKLMNMAMEEINHKEVRIPNMYKKAMMSPDCNKQGESMDSDHISSQWNEFQPSLKKSIF